MNSGIIIAAAAVTITMALFFSASKRKTKENKSTLKFSRL